MTGLEEALLSHLVLRGGERVIDFVKPSDTELRVAIKEAFLLAASDTDLPVGLEASWVADALLEDRLSWSGASDEIVGGSLDQPLALESTDFSERVVAMLPADLRSDLEAQGVDVGRVLERFGSHFVSRVRAHALDSKSTLANLASRIESDSIYGGVDTVASAVGANLEGLSETLDRLLEDSRQRILRRLDALQVDPAAFEDLFALIELIPPPALEPLGFFALVDEGGSGKSTLADRAHRESIRLAQTDSTSLLPVFLEATRLQGTLENEINRVWGGNPSLLVRGIDLVVDGVEEIGVDDGRRLILDARSLLRNTHSPVRRVLVTLRPTIDDIRPEERLTVELLSYEQSSAIVTRLAGEHSLQATYTSVIREAMRRPFFAIAVGSVIANPGAHFATGTKIIELVAKRAIAGAEWESEAELLGRLAADSLDNHHRPVHLASIASNQQQRAALERNRLLEVVDGDKVTFGVSLIAEWFAANHLLMFPNLVNELLADPDRLDLWRYPILFAIEMRAADEIDELLCELAAKAPAFAGWLLTQPDPYRIDLTAEIDPSQWPPADDRQFAVRFRSAFESLGQGLAPASLRLRLFEGGSLAPIWLATSGDRLAYSFHQASPDLPDIIDDPPQLDDGEVVGWVNRVGARMNEHPAWRWRHAQGKLRMQLEGLLKEGLLFSDSEVYRSERRWATALRLTGQSPLVTGAITVESATALLENRAQLLQQVGFNDVEGDPISRELRNIISHLELTGEATLSAPWPPPDHVDHPNFVWDVWSDEALRDRVEGVTSAGLQMYHLAVTKQLPRFAGFLRLEKMWPVRLVGYMEPSHPDAGFAGQPRYLWYVERGSAGPETSWTLVDDLTAVERDVYSSETIDRFSNGLLHSLYRSTPATGFATELLWDDLKEWGWTNGAAPRP